MKQVERTGDLEKECGRREVGGNWTSSTLLMYAREQWRDAQS
jgi:hypothetical protein